MNNSIRPKLEDAENEEDLLQMQEEFLSMSSTPAAKVVRKPPPSFGTSSAQKTNVEVAPVLDQYDNDMPELEDVPVSETIPAKTEPKPKKKSLFAARRAQASNATVEQSPEDDTPVTKRMIDINSMLGNVIGTVKETVPKTDKDVVKLDFDLGLTNRPRQASGFPQPVHRSEFRKRLDRKQKQEEVASKADTPAIKEEYVNEKYKDIHDENLNTLNSMSEEDIAAARAQLLASMDPELVKKLMTRKPMSERKGDEDVDAQPSKKVQFADINAEGDSLEEDHPLVMKKKYFENVESEPEKLAWMGIGDQRDTNSDIPSFTSEAAQLRFDFAGNIITDENVSVYKGLHHHGQNPNQAGYTLPELFHLMRSQVSSQRVIVLNTASRIIAKSKQLEYGSTVSESIWRFIIHDMKGIIYLRAALDDKYTVAVAAAISAIDALLCDNGFSSSIYGHLHTSLDRGYETIWQSPTSNEQSSLSNQTLDKKFTNTIDAINSMKEDEEPEEPKPDSVDAHAKLSQSDIVSALVQMKILPRLRYLLEHMCQPGGFDDGTVLRLIATAHRLAQNSDSVCEAIAVEEPKIVDLIVQHGIEQTQWPIVSISESASKTKKSSTRWPSLQAIQFLRTMAASKKQIAISVCVETGHVDNTLRFLTISPSVMSDAAATEHAFELQLATLELYRLLAGYGLYCHVMADLAPKIPLWIRSQDDLNASTWNTESQHVCLRAIATTSLLEVYLHNAQDTHKTLPEHDICWAQPTAFHDLVLSTFVKCASHFGELGSKQTLEVPDYMRLCLLSASMGYLATWCRYLDSNPPAEKIIVEDTWNAITNVLTQSSWFSTHSQIFARINASRGHYQPLQYPNLSGVYTPDMTEYLTWLCKRDIVADIAARLCQLMESYGRIPLSDIANKAYEYLVQDSLFDISINDIAKNYLNSDTRDSTTLSEKRRSRKQPALAVWSHLHAIGILTNLTQATRVPSKCTIERLTILCTYFMNNLCSGDEWPAHWIFSQILPNIVSNNNLTETTLEPFYKQAVGSDDKIAESKGLYLHDGRGIETLTLDYSNSPNSSAIPRNLLAWLLLPIDELYHADKSEILRELPHGYNATEPNIIVATLDKALQFYGISPHLDLTPVAITLMKIYLIGERSGRNVELETGWARADSDSEELFRDHNVTLKIKAWLDCISSVQLHVTLQQAWSDSSHYVQQAQVPFYQFYQDFAAQYAAVSFGDQSFARLLLLPALASSPIDYKHLLWSDMIDILPTIRITIDDLLGGHNVYLEPAETSDTILRDMLIAVCTRKVHKEDVNGGEKCALYWLALHHLRAAYLSEATDVSLKRDLSVLSTAFDQPTPWN
ncbi:hypothetical protein INT43_000425 [Umbelopsis isabellina]|uniref:RNA polymerase II-associated protein 1 n=1 Tax=Mortierella isabellina TaxID=91625 RepID=A0A8H7Q4H1_MORIS|nr:hypothetical protein INT43_000425 [Umbelopsis isabellina]